MTTDCGTKKIFEKLSIGLAMAAALITTIGSKYVTTETNDFHSI